VAPVAVGRFALEPAGGAVAPAVLEERRELLRRVMWDAVGIVRSDCGLQRACVETERLVRELEALYRGHRLAAELVQVRSLATVAQLIARSARQRLESRGVHYNRDHPTRDDAHWQQPTLLVRDGAALKVH